MRNLTQTITNNPPKIGNGSITEIGTGEEKREVTEDTGIHKKRDTVRNEFSSQRARCDAVGRV